MLIVSQIDIKVAILKYSQTYVYLKYWSSEVHPIGCLGCNIIFDLILKLLYLSTRKLMCTRSTGVQRYTLKVAQGVKLFQRLIRICRYYFTYQIHL